MTRMGARVWAALSLGTPPGLMGLATPPGTKARDTVAVLEVTPEGGVSNTVARVPHGLWERGPDTGSFELIRDEHAAWATIAGGGGRLFVATFGGDSLEVSAYRAGDGAGELSRYPVELTGVPRRGLRGMLASREGSLWIVEEVDESTVFGPMDLRSSKVIGMAWNLRAACRNRWSASAECAVVDRGLAAAGSYRSARHPALDDHLSRASAYAW